MKINKYVRTFFNVPDDGDGSADIDDSSEIEQTGDGIPEPVEEKPTAPAAPMLDAAAFAKQFADQISGAFPKEKEKELSPEEAKRLLNMWEPDESFLQEFGNVESQSKAFLKMRDGLTRQMVTIMQRMVEERENKMMEQFKPVLSHYQAQQAEAGFKEFGEAYPQLAKKELRPLVEHVAAQLKNSGQTYADKKAAYAAVASGVAAVIKATNPEFSLTASTPTGGGIPKVTPGSGGGGGGGGGGSQPKGKFKAVSLLS